MRLITYELGGRVTLGVLLPTGRAAPVAGLLDDPPADMVDLVDTWDQTGPALAAAAASLASRDPAAGEPTTALDADRRWRPPVPRPSKIMGVALNNGALSSLASALPGHPMLFCYPPSALTGQLQPIEIRPGYGLTHPEPELGVVIGRRVKNISADDALDAVFGYTVVDDVTSVDLKSGDTTVFPASFAETIGGSPAEPGAAPRGFEQGDLTLTYHARSKGADTFAPCGPWLVTRDEISDPHKLAVTLSIDDELYTEDNTANLVFSVADTIAHASRYFTLYPGDILHVGTAARGRYRLRDIDYQHLTGLRTIDIDDVGTLRNPIEHLPDDEERPR